MTTFFICAVETSIFVGSPYYRREVTRLLFDGGLTPPILPDRDSRTLTLIERWDRRSSFSKEDTQGLPEPHNRFWHVDGRESPENWVRALAHRLLWDWWRGNPLAANGQTRAYIAARVLLRDCRPYESTVEFAPLQLPEVSVSPGLTLPLVGVAETGRQPPLAH